MNIPTVTDSELISVLEQLRTTMVAVATGGPRIQDVEDNYREIYGRAAAELARRNIENPLIYASLWDWYGRWSSGDLPTYQSRRNFVRELIGPLVNELRTGSRDERTPTGWARVDRTVGELRDRFAAASTEEQYQAVGLLCREAIISVAQVVYDREKHPPIDGVKPSETDAKRMLDAYILVELGGGSSAESRRHARSALELAVGLQHRRTATFRDAALCVEASTSVINVIAIMAGRRDPQ